MINTFTRSPFKALMGWVVAAFLVVVAVGCAPNAPEAQEGGGLGEEIEEEAEEGEVEEGEAEEGETGEGGEGD
ncbi:hypothetical protein H6G00_18190 [Leptolyngbya sp. FACHB-541]|uniref:hypothetical protein n=1 Tax=Leptolyngbya sp. FACHB-541 TaxID=2692810 RepID=UPI0016839009|nr:hypothetical protein [Leptolyngbya sp. FACHB-541]MBD1998536.1 hypothetical protein [Leptolyngbya sp. FACHB-541]